LPEYALDFYPIIVNFGDVKEVFHVGRGSIAVPGAISAMFLMHQEMASMPMKNLLEYAIHYAKTGVVINTFQALDLNLLKDIFKIDPHAHSIFYKEGRIKREGDLLQLEQLPDFLTYLGSEGVDAFYKGEIARSIVQDMKGKGGMLTMHDFESYKTMERSPLSFQYRDQHISTTSYPSLGGALMNIYLHHIEEREQSESNLKRMVDAGIICDELLKHPDQIGQLLEDINPKAGSQFQGALHKGGTSHLNIIDKKGNAIAMTFTLGEGSGYFIKGTDMQLNNMLGESALLPDGFHSWTEDTRLMSMMCPTFARDETGRFIVLGSGGASRIPYAIGQVLDHLAHGEGLETSIRKPRAHVEHGVIHFEPNELWGKEMSQIQEESNHQIKQWKDCSLFFGGVHAICHSDGSCEAVGDFRRWGVSKVAY